MSKRKITAIIGLVLIFLFFVSMAVMTAGNRKADKKSVNPETTQAVTTTEDTSQTENISAEITIETTSFDAYFSEFLEKTNGKTSEIGTMSAPPFWDDSEKPLTEDEKKAIEAEMESKRQAIEAETEPLTETTEKTEKNGG